MDESSRRRCAPIAAAFSLAALLAASCAREGVEADEEHPTELVPFLVERDGAGTTSLRLTAESRAAIGLEVAVATPRSAEAVVLAFGRIEADGSSESTLRAPLAGRLAEHAGVAWPELGSQVDADAPLAELLPRVMPLTPSEHADLELRRAEAESTLASVGAALSADQAALERARALNADDQSVADQVVEAASALVATDLARRAAAARAIETLSALLDGGRAPLPAWPLLPARAGVVVAVLAQPGEQVEAGQPLLRTIDFSEVDAEVVVPPGAAAETLREEATLQASSIGAEWLPARWVGPASRGDGVGRALRLRVRDPQRRLRPGDGVVARLATARPARPVLEVPAAAIVRYGGRDWLYVEVEAGRFTRREVTLERAEAGVAWVGSGLAADARVVVVGAGELLSEEQMAAGGGGEE
ncbi:MAG: HlyD family efflux transporter periplasmic adaptor subunit [Planctomycetes bacterium]|nr:HlyD family efflux transporter periplasmic adaptor subunit [Planctomycetota bacterium]